jgi:DNA excision repair protein ERCC-3
VQLVREDGRDRELVELIGPKLYEANWMDLTRGGFLANVQVVEVWCPMTPAFLEEYLRAESMHRRSALAVMNPTKAWATSMLLKLHMERPDDKIIVFSDSRFALERYAKAFDQPMIHGGTTMTEREAILAAFREDSAVNVLFLSKVGDVALDVPDANVIIQISSHYGSRMQEAQRMGRILRKKKTAKSTSRNHAFFYSLLSTDTEEVAWSLRRRRYLVDQGYAYKVLTSYPGLAPRGQLQRESKFMAAETEQQAMLVDVLRSNIEAIDGKESKQVAQQAGASVFGASSTQAMTGGKFSGASTTRGGASMAELSGGTGLRYVEYQADRDGALTRLETHKPAAAAASRRASGLSLPIRSKTKTKTSQ